MTQTIISLKKQIKVASDLQTVVRSMKAVSASNISQYEKSLESLKLYYQNIELSLGLCLRQFTFETNSMIPNYSNPHNSKKVGVVIFGSDQGLVGNFNEVIAIHAMKMIEKRQVDCQVWLVGERLKSYFLDMGIEIKGEITLPNSAKNIDKLASQVLLLINYDNFYLLHNKMITATKFEPITVHLLPLDKAWRDRIIQNPWPNKNLAQVLGAMNSNLIALIKEYLFVSIFKACSQSLASENLSRLSAMQSADKNIEELLLTTKSTFHRLRQSSIDEELFDVVSGFEALSCRS